MWNKSWGSVFVHNRDSVQVRNQHMFEPIREKMFRKLSRKDILVALDPEFHEVLEE